MRFPGTMMVQTGFDPAEDHIGPFYFEPKGTAAFGGYGFELKAKHCNAMGVRPWRRSDDLCRFRALYGSDRSL